MKTDKDTPAKAAVARRQRYSAEFKRRLVRMSLAPGASAAKIALKHELNANLLFKWRRRCRRRLNFDHLCRLNFDQGSEAVRVAVGCG